MYGRASDTAQTCPAGVKPEYRGAAILPPGATFGYVDVEAVICGPDLAAGEATVRDVLASVRFAPTAP